MKALTTICSVLILLVSMVQVPAQAAMIATGDVVAGQQAQADREKVRDFLNRATVQEQMKVMGVNAALAKSRVDSLTPKEVATLAQRVDSLPAGGALSTTDIVIILLVAILVALIV
ncbi:PA2779 family protein [Pseudomonas sp. LS44]|uniref:PA2779 family protein n=1 Tax=Pseudomonas sp. LS44 TaxID=1357074 RepID=UPI00215ACDC1|nr:PA2779 family protein [Pseudomonas sp. LS44]UVE19009.1 PA2779 family protein [Pseudomonas sp. LS44]